MSKRMAFQESSRHDHYGGNFSQERFLPVKEAKGDILKFAEAISGRKGHRPDRGSPVRSRDPFRQMATSNGQNMHISRGIRHLLTPFRQLHLAGGGG